MSELEQWSVRDFEVATLAHARIIVRLRNRLWTPIAWLLRPRASFRGDFGQTHGEIWRGRGNAIERFILGLVPLMRFSANFFRSIVASTLDVPALLQDPMSWLSSLFAFVVLFLVLTVYTVVFLVITNIPVLHWLILGIRSTLTTFIEVKLDDVPKPWLKAVKQLLVQGTTGYVLSPAVAQFQLFLSAAIYMRDFDAEKAAVSLYEDTFLIRGQRVPPEPVLVVLKRTNGQDKLSITNRPVFDILLQQLNRADRGIAEQAARVNLSYITVSELDSGYGGPYCGLFTPPDKSFAVLAFKGTTPTDPTEFIIDADFLKVDASKYLAGEVHKGFYGSLFPVADSRAGLETHDTTSPMYRILAALRTLNADNDQPIKLYVTGHSLGAALAVLFYARLRLHPDDLATLPRISLQSLYVYGCPAAGDTTFARAVTQKEGVRLRIIDGDDLVTRLPPNFNGSGVGQDERPAWVRQGSIFDYVQVGTGARVTRTGKPVEISRRRELLDLFMTSDDDDQPLDLTIDDSRPTRLEQRVSPMLRVMTWVFPALADHSTVLYDLAIQKTFGTA